MGVVFQPCIIELLVVTEEYLRITLMWLNNKQITNSAICAYRESLLSSCPHHIVIDDLFDKAKLDEVVTALQQSHDWKTQQHTYSALYVDNAQWQQTSNDQRFVQRDAWQRQSVRANTISCGNHHSTIAQNFLSFLRGEEFLSLLSRIFKVRLTDINVADPYINTNYFRMGVSDFVEQHADDSPGREVCMLLYLNQQWNTNAGGELVFIGEDDNHIRISPLYNRCVLFDPASKGSEHWVERLKTEDTQQYRYNVTSWYWSE
jgi:SM-20-related protein